MGSQETKFRSLHICMAPPSSQQSRTVNAKSGIDAPPYECSRCMLFSLLSCCRARGLLRRRTTKPHVLDLCVSLLGTGSELVCSTLWLLPLVYTNDRSFFLDAYYAGQVSIVPTANHLRDMSLWLPQSGLLMCTIWVGQSHGTDRRFVTEYAGELSAILNMVVGMLTAVRPQGVKPLTDSTFRYD